MDTHDLNFGRINFTCLEEVTINLQMGNDRNPKIGTVCLVKFNS